MDTIKSQQSIRERVEQLEKEVDALKGNVHTLERHVGTLMARSGVEVPTLAAAPPGTTERLPQAPPAPAASGNGHAAPQTGVYVPWTAAPATPPYIPPPPPPQAAQPPYIPPSPSKPAEATPAQAPRHSGVYVYKLPPEPVVEAQPKPAPAANVGAALDSWAASEAPAPASHVAPIPAKAASTSALGTPAGRDLAAPKPHTIFNLLRKTQFWLSSAGILLFLFGVVLLFREAIASHWLSQTAIEWLQVGTGALLGTGLAAFGLRLHSRFHNLSQVLLGGSIATFYMTTYAARVLFPGLGVPYDIAFGAMAFVTVGAFVLALWGNDVSLALVGLLGGLVTPLVLNNWAVDIADMMAYMRVLIAGSAAVYIFRGWRSLLWTSLITSWLVIGTALDAVLGMSNVSFDARMGVQIAVLMTVGAFWIAPVLHEVLWHRYPARFHKPDVPLITGPSADTIANAELYLLPLAVPTVSLGVSAALWGDSVPQWAWGLITIGLAGVYEVVARLVREDAFRVSYMHRLSAIALVTLGVALCAGSFGWNEGLFLTVVAEAVVLHVAARRFKDKVVAAMGHILFGVAGLWTLARIVNGFGFYSVTGWDSVPFFNPASLCNFAAMAAAFGVSFLFVWNRVVESDRQGARPRQGQVGLLYRLAVYVTGFLWLVGESWALQGPNERYGSYVGLAMAAYAVLMQFAPWPRQDRQVTRGLAVLALAPTALVFLIRIALPWRDGEVPIFNLNTLIDAATLALAGLVAWARRDDWRVAVALRAGMTLGVMALLWRELIHLENGDAYVLVAWALCGTALHWLAWRDGKAAQALVSANTTLLAHVVWVIPGVWLLERLMMGFVIVDRSVMPFFNIDALANFGVMALAFATSFLIGAQRVAQSDLVAHRDDVVEEQTDDVVDEDDEEDITTPEAVALSDRVPVGTPTARLPRVPTLPKALAGPAALAIPLVQVSQLYRLAAHIGMLLWVAVNAEGIVGPNHHYGSYIGLGVMAYAALLHFVGRPRQDTRANQTIALGAIVPVALLLLWRIFQWHSGYPAMPILNGETAIDAATLGLVGLIAWTRRDEWVLALTLRTGIIVGVVGVLLREFLPLRYGDAYIMFALALAGLLLHLMAWRDAKAGQDQTALYTRMMAHVVSAVAGLWMIGHIVVAMISLINTDRYDTPLFNAYGLTGLGMLAMGVALAYFLRRDRNSVLGYGLWSHVAFLGLSWQEVVLIDNGNAFATMIWGIYALALIGATIWWTRTPHAPSSNPEFTGRVLFSCGIATLLGAGAKIIIIDLNYVEAIWKILLLLGFGALFLALSYYFQKILKPAS